MVESGDRRYKRELHDLAVAVGFAVNDPKNMDKMFKEKPQRQEPDGDNVVQADFETQEWWKSS